MAIWLSLTLNWDAVQDTPEPSAASKWGALAWWWWRTKRIKSYYYYSINILFRGWDRRQVSGQSDINFRHVYLREDVTPREHQSPHDPLPIDLYQAGLHHKTFLIFWRQSLSTLRLEISDKEVMPGIRIMSTSSCWSCGSVSLVYSKANSSSGIT